MVCDKRVDCSTMVKRICISLGALLIMLLFGIYRINTDDSLEIRILYKYYTEVNEKCDMVVEADDEIYTIYPHLPVEDTKQGGWIDAVYTIPNSIHEIKDISVVLLQQKPTEACITSLEIYNHSIPVSKYRASEIPLLFDDNADKVVLDSIGINYSKESGQIMLSATDALTAELLICRTSDRWAYFNCIIISIVISVVVFVFLKKELLIRIKRSFSDLTLWDWITLLVLSVMFVACCVMAFGSKHHAHCDEEVTRHAIDYYLRAWIAPKSTSNWVAGTASYRAGNVYRALEANLYYFFAGKVGWVAREYFHVKMYYRTLGICLLLFLMGTCWVNRDKKSFLFATIMLSPQISYLFSYATSDHWDYFWGVIILLITCDKESILYRIFDKKSHKLKRVTCLFLCALLFSLMFTGKSNYMIVLIIPFSELLINLIKSKEKLRLIMLYGVILISTIVLAYGLKNRYRDPGIPNQMSQDGESRYERDTTPWTPNEVSGAPRDKGISFHDFMWNMAYQPTPVILYMTALGTYFWNSVNPGTWLYYLLTILYGFFAFMLCRKLVIQKDPEKIAKTVIGVLASALMFGVAVWYCFVQTYEPQGRYILPIFIIVGYMITTAGDYHKSLPYRIVMGLICIICLYSYLAVALLGGYRAGFML